MEGAWSRAILIHQIDTQFDERQGAASHNFARTMPAQRAVLASSAFKDPYGLEFVELGEAAHERHLEAALVDRIQNLLLEMGRGFAFIGNQHRLQVGERDFYIDLLFNHTKLHSYVVVELKLGEFEPEYVSKMGFYLTAVDAQVATANDNPSIGLLLCRGRDGLVVEYALRTTAAPMAVATYRVLPPGMEAILPAAQATERVLMEEPAPVPKALRARRTAPWWSEGSRPGSGAWPGPSWASRRRTGSPCPRGTSTCWSATVTKTSCVMSCPASATWTTTWRRSFERMA